MNLWAMDTETYANYHLVMVKHLTTGEIKIWEKYEGKLIDRRSLKLFLTDQQNEIITFNGNKYDFPVLSATLSGADCSEIKDLSDQIILGTLKLWQIKKRYPQIEANTIDLSEPAPGVKVSLKQYGARMHSPKLQDLPIEPSAMITPHQRELLKTYCENDLDTTIDLYRSIEKQIDLRRAMSQQYGLDLRSKSDAQIAEAVICYEVEKRTGVRPSEPKVAPGTTYRYKSPGFINFQTDLLKNVHAIVKSAKFVVGENGSVELPPELAKLKIKIGNSAYQMGIGGLHSTEKSIVNAADSEHVLIDRDVASYYPSIILRCGLYPKHMGRCFLDIYQSFVTKRLEAKRTGNAVVRDSFKILLNGSFGKFGSPYSALYSPDLLIQTTLTGQLALLQLIEQLESQGIGVVSANTDGIVIRCPRSKLGVMGAVVGIWEWFSCFETEATEYTALYSKDVNNYLAVKPDGSVKSKGLYAEPGLMKNPTGAICVDAVREHLVSGARLEETIRRCADIARFTVVRNVKGGGVFGDEYLGKTVRWYYSADLPGASINYRTNGNKVAKSDGGRPVMRMPDAFPDDVDYERYAEEARSILRDIGVLNDQPSTIPRRASKAGRLRKVSAASVD